MKEMNKETKADYIRNVDPEDINDYIRTLPFELTADQDEAIKEAEVAFQNNEVPVGAVLIKDGKIAAKSHNFSKTNKTLWQI